MNSQVGRINPSANNLQSPTPLIGELLQNQQKPFLHMTPELGASLEAINAQKEEEKQLLASITKDAGEYVYSIYGDILPSERTEKHSIRCQVVDNWALLNGTDPKNANEPIILVPGYRNRDYLTMAQYFASQGVHVVIAMASHEAKEEGVRQLSRANKSLDDKQKEELAHQKSGLPVIATRDYIAQEYKISKGIKLPVISISLGTRNVASALDIDRSGFGDIYNISSFTGVENFKPTEKSKLDLCKTSLLSGLPREDSEDLFSKRDEPIGSSKEETRLMGLSGGSEVVGILRKSSKTHGAFSTLLKFASTGFGNVLHRSNIAEMPGLISDTKEMTGALGDVANGIFRLCVKACMNRPAAPTFINHSNRNNM